MLIWRHSSNVKEKTISNIVSCKAAPSSIDVVWFHKLSVTTYVVFATPIQRLLCLSRWSCHVPFADLLPEKIAQKGKQGSKTLVYPFIYVSFKLREIREEIAHQLIYPFSRCVGQGAILERMNASSSCTE